MKYKTLEKKRKGGEMGFTWYTQTDYGYGRREKCIPMYLL